MQTIGCKVLFKCTDKDYHCGDQDFDQLEVGVASAAGDAVLVHRREVAVALQDVFCWCKIFCFYHHLHDVDHHGVREDVLRGAGVVTPVLPRYWRNLKWYKSIKDRLKVKKTVSSFYASCKNTRYFLICRSSENWETGSVCELCLGESKGIC